VHIASPVRRSAVPSTGLIAERLIPVVLEQKVTGAEARRAYRRMSTALAEPAPGAAGLLLPPDPERLAMTPYERFHPFGIERRRAEVLRRLGAHAVWLDAAVDLPLHQAKERMGSLHGIGPWSVAEVARVSLGDTDAVSVGDFHVPSVVTWALAREPRGTDERMLELLEPHRPHRGRVQLLLEAAGIRPPAFGPRMESRAIDVLRQRRVCTSAGSSGLTRDIACVGNRRRAERTGCIAGVLPSAWRSGCSPS
jgi:3-methyladenine DNA glycosylase/8-oxoguanine DNA glycosylase